MTEQEKSGPPRAKRKWPRRLGWSLLAAAVLLLVFHKPILIAVLHTAAVRFALKQNVELSLDIEGNVLTNLSLKNVRAKPTGTSPVEMIEIESAQVHYSFLRLLREGPSEFLSSYHLHNAYLVLSPIKGTESQKTELTNFLRGILEQPALFSDQVEVDNFNLIVHLPEGNVVLKELNLWLDPVKPGYLRAKEISILDFPSWRDIDAVATYANRHLVATNFRLGDAIGVSRVDLDSSERGKGVNYLSFKGTVMGGDVGLFLWRQQLNDEEVYAQFTAAVSNLSLKELRDFLRLEPEISGTVTHAWVQVGGDPDIPTSWKGDATLQVDKASVEGVEIGGLAAQLSVRNGVARLTDTSIFTGENRLSIESEYRLPNFTRDLFTDDIDAALKIDAPALSKIYPGFTGGVIRGDGSLQIRDRRLTLTLNTTAADLAGTVSGFSFGVGKGTSVTRATYELRERPAGTPWFDGVAIQTEANLEAIRADAWKADAATAAMALEEGVLTIRSAELRSGANTAKLSGRWRLPADPAGFSWEKADFDVGFDIAVPSLAAFSNEQAQAAPRAFDGAVIASGEFHRGGGQTRGNAKITATDLVFQEFSARRLTAEIPVENNVAKVTAFELDLNGTDKLTGHGSLELREPYAYEGSLSGSISDLSIFSPILKRPLSGSLQLDWRGSGQLRSLRHSGEGHAAVQRGTFDGVTGIDAEIAGVYSPEVIDIPTLRVRTDLGAAQAVVRLRDQQLGVSDLRVEIGKEGLITGGITLPIDLRTPENPETILPETGTIDGKLTLREIEISKLMETVAALKGKLAAGEPEPRKVPAASAFDKTVRPPVRRVSGGAPASPSLSGPEDLGLSGRLNATVVATGTVASPEFTLTLQGRDIRARAAKDLKPASLDASFAFRENRLTLNGTLKLPALSPLQFSGNIPLELRKVAGEGGINPDTPIEFSIKLPSSSAAVVTRFVPALRYVEGNISVDATAGGTLGNPDLKGGATINLPAVRFRNTNLPGINDFAADLRFAGDQLTIRRFQGDLAGGPFSMSGRVLLQPLANPELDLRVRSQGTLIVRNDSMTVRADSDIKIAGPLNSAAVTGRVGIIKSRFFREIEILPIGLPGRPAPQLVDGPPANPSIDIPPFRNWTFDIAIRTAEPFLIRSNLAQGRVTADLRLGGNGLAPTLEGTAQIENFVASLPFSRLEVTYGYVYFTPGEPFNPTLDIQGSSRLRNYNINVYIYGTANEPQTVFTAEPPLAQEEIITLLATGATTEEFTQNSQVLAGRAGILLLQNLYRKIFKRKAAPPSAGQHDFGDRFDFDVGSVDPRTGRQQVGGTFKLTDHFNVGAGLDLEGDVRVELRYLIRFR